ncbi:hypothetical protein [Arvimicrobium flavum]|uniref:hypothetical protein n=1 Tax=Arvimicrobium flavum TaxID=3393320 RepID=UPI00237B33BC|nr:hypothetical protein [Mesorhizobium shangrilense]
MWQRIKTFFKDSETIAWARAQAFIGTAANLITFVDPNLVTAVIPVEYARLIAVYMLLSGLATEYLRRRRAEDL